MAGTSLLEIQKAIRLRLLNNSSIAGRVSGGIFDDVPNTRTYPYITIGEAIETKFNTFGRDGKEVVHTLHVWSDYEGFKQALEIMDLVNEELDSAELVVPGFSLVYIQFEDIIPLRDIIERIHHVIARYRIIVQHN